MLSTLFTSHAGVEHQGLRIVAAVGVGRIQSERKRPRPIGARSIGEGTSDVHAVGARRSTGDSGGLAGRPHVFTAQLEVARRLCDGRQARGRRDEGSV